MNIILLARLFVDNIIFKRLSFYLCQLRFEEDNGSVNQQITLLINQAIPNNDNILPYDNDINADLLASSSYEEKVKDSHWEQTKAGVCKGLPSEGDRDALY